MGWPFVFALVALNAMRTIIIAGGAYIVFGFGHSPWLLLAILPAVFCIQGVTRKNDGKEEVHQL
jgi:hypothetical protein